MCIYIYINIFIYIIKNNYPISCIQYGNILISDSLPTSFHPTPYSPPGPSATGPGAWGGMEGGETLTGIFPYWI